MKTRYILGILFLALCAKSFSQVTVSGAASGNSSYTTLKAAFDAINGTGQSGRNIVITITGNTTETATATLSAGAWTTLKIYPTANSLAISGNLAGMPLIDLNGADNVTIDGRVNQTGTSISLTISNTSTSSSLSTSTIRFINDATTDYVKYCSLKGSSLTSTGTAAGIILLSTTSGTSGNDYVTIDNNNITNAGGNRPRTAIMSLGTPSKTNDYCSITNNNIYDILNLTADKAYGINVYSNSSLFTISGNSFYETASLVPTASYEAVFININSNYGYTISNNFIGGSAASCGGTAMTKTNAFSNNFTGLYLSFSAGGTSSIQGNTIKNITWNGCLYFYGIYMNAGNVDIGATTGNTFGASTGNGSITTDASAFMAITTAQVTGNTGTVTVSNNTVGSLALSGDFYGIRIVEGSSPTVSGNLIGSTSTANSISTSAPVNVYGIMCESSNATSQGNCTNNTVANLTVTATGSITTFSGMSVNGKVNNVTGNSVYNLTTASSAVTSSMYGIKYAQDNTVVDRSVSQNTVYGLTASNSSFTNGVYGIYYSSTSTSGVGNISRNYIYNLSINASNQTAGIVGLYMSSSVNARCNNNIVSLGTNSNLTIHGISDNSTISYLYYNTVYLSGSPNTATNVASYAFMGNASQRNYRNNVFFNARTNSGSSTAKHYALSIPNSGTITIDYNDYFVSGTGGVLGLYNGVDKTTLANWKLATSQDANSLNTNPTFANAGGSSASDYTPGVTLTGIEVTGALGVTFDYTNTTRVAPVTMGAFEGIPSITSFTPTSAGTGFTVTISGTALNGTTAVSFGGTAASSFNVVSSTSITAVVNNGSSGSVSVTNAQGTGTLTGFTYISTPTTQAYNISFASTTNVQSTVSWANGNGSSRAVFIKAASSGSASPVNGTTYTANTIFGSGTQIGSTLWYCIYNGTGTSVTVTGLTAGTTYRVMVCEYNGSTGTQLYNTSTATNNPNNVTTAAPAISVSGGFNSFSACYSNASDPQQVQVSGSYLTANITITSPAGFEVSTSSGSGYATSLTLTQSGGTVASTNVYSRLKSTNAVGSYSGNITFASTGATTQNAAVSGTVNSNLSSVNVSPSTSQTVCGNSYWNATGNTLTVTETGSSISYRYWGKRSVSGGAITPISGEVMSTFTPAMSNLDEGNWYIVCVSTPVCGVTTISNEVYVTVHLNPTVDFISGQSYAYIDSTSTLSCSTGGGVWSSTTPSIATINQSGLVTAVTEGNTEIKYTVNTNGCSNYSNTWFSAIKFNQTISFTLNSPLELGVSPVTLNGTATSGLVVSYASSDTNVAKVSGNILTIVGTGNTNITASQAGNAYYYAASDVQQSLEVFQKTPQTISFTLDSIKNINSQPFVLFGSSSSGLSVSYTSSNPDVASVSGNTVTINGMGYSTITASQAGNAVYAPAPNVSHVLIVTDTYNTWIGGVSGSETDWNADNNWSYGYKPGAYEWASIPSFPAHMPHVTSSIETPCEIGNVKIYAGASLTINPGKALTVYGDIQNSAGAGGLIIDSDSTGTGSLLCNTEGVQATFRRYVSGSSNLDSMMYHLVSIPVTPDTYSESSLFLGSYLYDFDSWTNSWNGLGIETTTELDETKGYMVYSPENDHTYEFQGPLNAGDFTMNVVSAWNKNILVPNPYPCSLDWDSWGWYKNGIANALYLWPSGGYNYVSYVDGISVPFGTENPNIIPPGQAFFVKTNSYDVYLASNYNAKLHSARPFQKAKADPKDLLRVVGTANGKQDETLIRFLEQATQNADSEHDAWKFEGLQDAPQIYSVSEDSENLSINSLPYTNETSHVPLSFKLDRNANATLSFSNIQSFDNSVRIALSDKISGQLVNIRQNPTYDFAYSISDPSNRFELIFDGTTGVRDQLKDETRMWFSENYLYISTSSSDRNPVLLVLYNSAGQEFYRKEFIPDGLNRFEFDYKGPVVANLIDNHKTYNVKGILSY